VVKSIKSPAPTPLKTGPCAVAEADETAATMAKTRLAAGTRNPAMMSLLLLRSEQRLTRPHITQKSFQKTGACKMAKALAI
jgi:hypothetical protein